MNLGLLNKGTLLSILIILLALTGMAQTTFTVGNLNYQVNDDSVSVTVTGHVNGYDATGELNIPESVSYEENDYTVTAIGSCAFLYCFYLTDLTIPNTVTTIGESAFAYCQSFTGDLVISNSITNIEYGAFQYCFGLNGLVLGDSVETIGDYAFNSCDNLTGKLYIPSTVTSLGGNSFGYCALDSIVVDSANSFYDSRNDCNAIIETSTNELITGCKNSFIPNTVTSIGYCAFRGIDGLESIEFPESLVSIGENAFAFCYDLKGDLTIPNSVTTIGSSAFFDCQGLDGTLTIGESVTLIGDWAFRNCCTFTSAVSLAQTPPTLDDEFGGMVFDNFGTPILTVPCECSSEYQNSNWYEPYAMNGFATFIEDCSVVTEAGTDVMTVYPNPTEGAFHISGIADGGVLTVSDMSGRTMVYKDIVDSDDMIDLSLSPGLYLITLTTNDGIRYHTQLIVK